MTMLEQILTAVSSFLLTCLLPFIIALIKECKKSKKLKTDLDFNEDLRKACSISELVSSNGETKKLLTNELLKDYSKSKNLNVEVDKYIKEVNNFNNNKKGNN